METRPFNQETQEQEPKYHFVPSFSDQFFLENFKDSDIPDSVLTDGIFKDSVEKRKEIVNAYEEVVSSVSPTKEQWLMHYKTFTEGLERDPQLLRSILYYPISFIPPPDTENKQEQAFLEAYRGACKKLLNEDDIRADFFDGDILEPELRNGKKEERVIKILHLYPDLLEKGIIHEKDIIDLIENNSNKLCIEGLADCVPVFMKKGLLSVRLREVIEHSPYEVLHASLVIGNSVINVPPNQDSGITLNDLINTINANYTSVISLRGHDTTTKRRKDWQEKDLFSKIQNTYKETLANHFGGGISYEMLVDYYKNASPLIKVVCLGALETKIKDSGHDTSLRNVSKILASTVQEEDNEIVRYFLQIFINHSRTYGVETALHTEPQFALAYETKEVTSYKTLMKEIVREIENDNELNALMYPCVLGVGSFAKGYAMDSSDKDVALFIRPHVSENDKEKIQKLLSSVASKYGAVSFLQFWLEETQNGYSIKNNGYGSDGIGNNTITHPLTGMWADGGNEETGKLRKGLLKNYLFNQGVSIVGTTYGEVWPKDIEHNLLQYRLMHSGFSQFYPKKNEDNYFSIDGESVFYDEQYRKLATSIYFRKVFIPKVSAIS